MSKPKLIDEANVRISWMVEKDDLLFNEYLVDGYVGEFERESYSSKWETSFPGTSGDVDILGIWFNNNGCWELVDINIFSEDELDLIKDSLLETFQEDQEDYLPSWIEDEDPNDDY